MTLCFEHRLVVDFKNQLGITAVQVAAHKNHKDLDEGEKPWQLSGRFFVGGCLRG